MYLCVRVSCKLKTRFSMKNPIEIIAESLFSRAFAQIKFANTCRKFE